MRLSVFARVFILNVQREWCQKAETLRERTVTLRLECGAWEMSVPTFDALDVLQADMAKVWRVTAFVEFTVQ